MASFRPNGFFLQASARWLAVGLLAGAAAGAWGESVAPMDLKAGFDGSIQIEALEGSGAWRLLPAHDGSSRPAEPAYRSTFAPGDIRLFRWPR